MKGIWVLKEEIYLLNNLKAIHNIQWKHIEIQIEISVFSKCNL